MAITAKGKRWEVLHSLWIGWTIFTLGFLNWIAFAYIGIRTRQRKWLLWGLLYSGPLLLSVSYGPKLSEGLTNLAVALELFLWAVSIVHAFIARKEYLLRLDAIQRRKSQDYTKLKSELTHEYGEEVQREETSAPISVPSDMLQTVSEHEQDQEATQLTKKPSAPVQTAQSQRIRSPKQVQPTMADRTPVTEPHVATPDVLSGDELEYRISSSYPFPIAFGFRSLTSIVDYRDLYREQLRIAENILAFLASVSLALLREQDRQNAQIVLDEYWRSGISPGDWRDIVGRCSKVLATYEDNPLALSLGSLNIRSEKKGFGHDVAKLIQAKNDYKHDRGPTVLEDIAGASQEVQDRLKRCMERLSFFAEYPIRQVEDFNVSRSGNEVFLKCLRFMGDHPSFPQEEVVFHRALPRGDLFLELDGQNWVPLYPFIVTMTCSHCKARETYFIDLWDARKGTVRMKSFERGHTMSNADVSEALAQWNS